LLRKSFSFLSIYLQAHRFAPRKGEVRELENT
jgi:hypothetical protein